MKKITIILLASVLFIGLNTQALKAQGGTGTTHYFMTILPQQSNNNPAFIPNVKSYFSVPALGNIHLELNNELTSWNRLLQRGADDSLRLNVNNFISKLENKNIFRVAADVEIIRFGFQGAGGFFHAGIAAHGEANLVFTKNLFDFALRGMGANINEPDIKGNGINAMAYAYLYLGYSRQIGKKLTVGGRVKLINGLAVARSKKLDIKWSILNDDFDDENFNPDITPYSYEFETDIQMQSTVGLPSLFGGNGFNWFDISKWLGNIGFGIDLGMTYAITPNLTLSASVLDMGAIFWKKGTGEEYVSNRKTPYLFQGVGNINIKNMVTSFDSILSPIIQEIKDSILGFQKTETEKFATALPTQFLVGAGYTIAEMHTFGVLLKGQIINNRFFNFEAGVSYTFMIKNFGISVNNTFTRNSALNFGAAFAVNMGPIQLHLGVDRLNSFNVAGMRGVNFNFGLNVLLGKKEILRSKIQAQSEEEAAEQNMKFQR